MTLRPTENQLRILQSVERSSIGIDSVPNREDALGCVGPGWISHVEHRRDDGGVIDVWTLTQEGRHVLEIHSNLFSKQLDATSVDDEGKVLGRSTAHSAGV